MEVIAIFRFDARLKIPEKVVGQWAWQDLLKTVLRETVTLPLE